MLAKNIKTSVCIIGAGPVGMSMALMLKRFGIDSVILERSKDIAEHPKAHVISPRAMEILREIDVEKDVISGLEPIEQWSSFRYWRSVLDPNPYGIHNHFKSGIKAEMDSIMEHSMSPVAHYSQNRFWQILKKKLMTEENKFVDINSREKYHPILFNHKFLSYDFNEDEYKLKVQAVNLEQMETRNIDCKYIIGCDGVSSKIRESIGGEFLGPRGIANFTNIHFKSKQLADTIKERNCHAMLYFIYNANIATILVNHSLKHSEFVLQTPYFPPIQNLADIDHEAKVKAILHAINGDGLDENNVLSPPNPKFEVTEIDEIGSIGTWQMSACYSDIFGDAQRKVFIAGDSGHSIPPAGGFGMNSGIADAHNLAHKIADAEFNNNHSVLEAYSPERRFVDEMVAKSAHINFRKGEKIVEKLNVDMKTFKDITKGLDYYVPKIIPRSLIKGAFDTVMKVAQRVSLNSYSIKQKRDYLKSYDNGIALLFPNLDFSYWYPQNEDDKKEATQFISKNFDNREFKLINKVGSLLPLFEFWCPQTKSNYRSREYWYQYQNEEKRPFYFLFVFGSKSDNIDKIDWIDGNIDQNNDFVFNEKVYLQTVHVRNISDPSARLKPHQKSKISPKPEPSIDQK